MKYLIFWTDGDKEELVGVEYGDSFSDVADKLVKTVNDDLAYRPEYSKFEVGCQLPDKNEEHPAAGTQYDLTGIVSPLCAEKNILVDYKVFTENE